MIYWTDFFIKRPLFSFSIHILLIVFGIIAFSRLEIRLYPKLESSIIKITVDYPGGSATTMRNFVTNRIYDAVGNLDSLNYITANNIEGEANINIHLKIGTSPQEAVNQILPNMMSLKALLPKGVHDPIISILDPNENPDYLLAFTSNDGNSAKLFAYLNGIIKPYFSVLPGVSSVHILGTQAAITISLNPDLMKAYGLESSDVVRAVQSQNRLSMEESLEGRDTELKVKLNSNINSPEELKNLVLKQKNQGFVHLSDISKIEWGPETNKIQSFYDKNTAVLVSIKTASHSNMIQVLQLLSQKLNAIKNKLPAGVSVHVLVNGRDYLVGVMLELLKTFIISLSIMILISLCFFNNIRSAFMIVLTIPISLLGSGVILWFLGASINLLTLLAMILTIGLLVDDAIVLLENIIRYIENGASIIDACYSATREIAFPLIAMTLSLGALFFPVAFVSGITGKLFFEFSLTLVSSVLISGFVSLTLLPVLSSRFLKKDLISPLGQRSEIVFEKLREKYFQILQYLLTKKKLVIAIWLVISFLGIYVYSNTPNNFAPKEDARLLEVFAQAPTASNTHLLLANAESLSQIYHGISDIHSYSLLVGVPSLHQILSFVRLKSAGESKHTLGETQQLLQEKINQNSIKAVALIPSLMPGTQGMPLEFVIESHNSYRDLYQLSQKMIKTAQKSGLFLFLTRDLQYDQPSFELQINRNTAAILGVSIESIENSISTFLGENTFQYVTSKGQLYPVIVKSNMNLIKDPDFLNKIFIKNRKERLIALSNLVELKRSVSPEQENQFQKLNSITISAVLNPFHSLSQGITFFKNEAKQLLPESASYDFSGSAREFIAEGDRMNWIFFAAFFVIFIVLSIQFESFLDPLIILLGSLPIGIFGAILPFELGIATMNIYSEIGLLVLSGLICKQGILITHFANKRKRACSPKTAIIEAVSIRFRPILMTIVAMVLGALPLILSGGPGHEARFSLGLVIFSGMLLGSFFSLFILPILYLFLHHEKQEV